MKKSLRQRLLDYLRKIYPSKIAKGELDRLVMRNTKFIPENCGRRLRELQNDGLIEVSYNEKNHAFYQATKPREITKYTIPEVGEKIIYKW